ncbi:MAG TPA: hypothetical protein DCE42_07690, partial [Myxococcales bacterium]|nr:hypothetical protein [Myxococcales bacterium]
HGTAMSTTNHDACGFSCNLHVRFFFLYTFFLAVALQGRCCIEFRNNKDETDLALRHILIHLLLCGALHKQQNARRIT